MVTILVVEDDTDTRDFIDTVLHLEGYDTIDCVTVEEAMQETADIEPQLAILDINLPLQHGVSLAWELRQRWVHLPIIIGSAVLGQWDLDDLYDCGADYILQKPYDLSYFQKIVSDCIHFGRSPRRGTG